MVPSYRWTIDTWSIAAVELALADYEAMLGHRMRARC
jgi:hypothetical protein